MVHSDHQPVIAGRDPGQGDLKNRHNTFISGRRYIPVTSS
jgi:hypothetical protein